MPSLPDIPRRHMLGLAAGAATVGLPSVAHAADTTTSSDGVSANAAGSTVSAEVASDSRAKAPVPTPQPAPVSLTAFYNHDAIDTATAHDGNFDGSGYSFPGDSLPANGLVTVGGVPYQLGSFAAGAKNDIVALGQTIPLPAGRYLSLLFL